MGGFSSQLSEGLWCSECSKSKTVDKRLNLGSELCNHLPELLTAELVAISELPIGSIVVEAGVWWSRAEPSTNFW